MSKVHIRSLSSYSDSDNKRNFVGLDYVLLNISISPEASCLVYVFVSLSRWLTGYEILAFEKPSLHYHKISTESLFIYAHGVNGNEPIENMQLYMGYSPEKLERRLGLN